MKSGFKVLVVDDDVFIRHAIANILKKCECDVVEAERIEDAFDCLASEHYDAVFCDMRFNGELGGGDLLAHTIEKYPNTSVVLMSCSMSDRQKTELRQKGAACCLQKPFFRDTCLTVLSSLGHSIQKAA